MNLTKITQEIEVLEKQLADVKAEEAERRDNCDCHECREGLTDPEYAFEIRDIEDQLDKLYAHMDELLDMDVHS